MSPGARSGPDPGPPHQGGPGEGSSRARGPAAGSSSCHTPAPWEGFGGRVSQDDSGYTSRSVIELPTGLVNISQCLEKVPSRASSLLKTPTRLVFSQLRI